MLGKQLTTQFNMTLKAGYGKTQQLKYAKVYSSSVARCIASAESHLLGVFPLGTGMKVTSDVKDVLTPPYDGMTVSWDGGEEALQSQYMPVVIEVQDDYSMDTMFNPHLSQSCPKGNSDLYSMTQDYKNKIQKEIQPFIDQINNELTAQNFSSIKTFNKTKYDWSTLYQFYDALMSDKYYTGKYPDSLKNETIDKLILLVSYHAFLEFDINNFSKLRTHVIGNTIVQELLAKKKLYETDPVKFAESLKYLAFSGHDSNLLPFMHALGVSNTKCLRTKIDAYMKGKVYEPKNDDPMCELFPDFASGFVMELSYGFGDEGFFITTYYNGKKFDLCNGKGPQNYPGSCKFEYWIDIFIEKSMDADFNRRCFGSKDVANAIQMKERKLQQKPNGNNAKVEPYFIVSMVLLTIAMAEGVLICGYIQKKNERSMKIKSASISKNSSVGMEGSDQNEQNFNGTNSGLQEQLLSGNSGEDQI